MRSPAERVYRVLLRVFPREFRTLHGDAMTAEVVRQHRALAGRPLKGLALWTRIVADALRHGLGVRRDQAHVAIGDTGWALLGSWRLDLRDAWRGLRRTPGITLAVLAILTLGVAANSVMVGTVDQLLLRAPSGVGDPDRVRRVHFGSETLRPGQLRGRECDSYPFVAALRDGVAAFERAAVTHRANAALGAGAAARQVTADLVDPGYFSVLDVQPHFGRFFTDVDASATPASPVVVLSHRLWQTQFGGDPSVLGQSVRVEGQSRTVISLTVIGVGPRGFVGLEDEATDMWSPLTTLAPTLVGPDWATSRGRCAFGLVALLAPNGDSAVAESQATAVVRRVGAELASRFHDDATAFTAPLRRVASPNGILPQGRVSVWLLGVSAIVLLISVANVAALLLTRTISRRREIAVRLALGVSRGRLLRQFLTESALLAGGAVVLALGVASAGGHLVQSVVLPGFAWSATIVDVRVLATTLAIGLVITIGVGILPAFHGMSTGAATALRAGGRGEYGRAGVVRNGLLLVQVALCVLLLVGAGLFTRSLHTVVSKDVGLDLDRIVQVRLPRPPGQSLGAADGQHAMVADVLTRLPDVESVVVPKGSAPMGGGALVSARPEGWDVTDLKGPVWSGLFGVDERYFSTLGMRLIHGRGFTTEEVRSGAPVLVANRAFGDEFYPGVDPVGQCVFVDSGSCLRLIGLVENSLLYSRTEVRDTQVFLPAFHSAVPQYSGALLVRTRGPASEAVPVIRAAVQGAASDIPFVRTEALAALTAPELQPWRLGMTMFLLFGGMALVVAMVGVYSAVAHAAAQRTHEIGVRVALGATRTQVVVHLGRTAVVVIGAGLTVGLVLALGLSPSIADLLFETHARDPLVFGGAAFVLVVASAVATLLPIRRSAAVDPLTALRTE
jgi:predicted permease